jgi:hypothetical protein
MKIHFFIFIILSTISINSIGQQEFIHSKNGDPVLNRRQFIANCLKAFHKDKTDRTALSICQCQTDKLEKHFTNKQYRKYTFNNGIDLIGLLKEDSLFEKSFQACYTNSGKSILLQAEGFENEFISNCIKSVQRSSVKKLDIDQLTGFCRCQLGLVKANKISDVEMEEMKNPNSLLFFEMMYKCGNPFKEDLDEEKNWNQYVEKDILGPTIDTIKVLNLNGMTYLKVKIGNLSQVWLFDTGASDLLINTDMEQQLKLQNIITDSSYLGIGEYEMANGIIDTCRRYKIGSVQLGKFVLKNVIVAVTEKGKRIIVGKGLLNKFSNWTLSNKENTLILTK